MIKFKQLIQNFCILIQNVYSEIQAKIIIKTMFKLHENPGHGKLFKNLFKNIHHVAFQKNMHLLFKVDFYPPK